MGVVECLRYCLFSLATLKKLGEAWGQGEASVGIYTYLLMNL